MDDDSFNLPLQQTPDVESPSPTITPLHEAYPPLAPSGSHNSHNQGHDHGHQGHGHGHHVAGQAHAQAAAQPMPPMAGATIYTPNTAPSSELNPRSCVTCRRRKVRCDKLMPCTNCRRAMVPCVFPAPERAPRRPRRKDPVSLKPHQSSEREIELLKRLRKLEGIVEELSGQVEMEATSGKLPASNSNSPEAAAAGSDGAAPRSSLDHGTTPSASSSWGQSPKLPSAQGPTSGNSPGRLIGRNSSYGALVKQTKDTQKQLGRLMINDYGRSRYVSSAFWSKINDELDEIRAETQRISDSESDLSDNESTPGHDEDRPEADHHAFIFGFQSTTVDLRPLHPLPSQIPYIWQVYQENVDPVVKILHIPTTSKVIRDARTNLDNISPAAEALMFAIYYAAVNSLDESEIHTNFVTEKNTLLNKYRFALEQALAKANFLISSDLVTLQAFVLLLVLVRRQEDTRLAWTLTGLAIRICHSIGLHRDGTNFSTLSPFEIEMRRRLFWALCILDMRCAEDQGTDLTILEQGVDTLPPLNINDTDISPESTSLPPSRVGATDMTFALIRFEICRVARRLHAIHSAMGPIEAGDATLTLEDRERMIHEVYDRVENVYLKHGDTHNNAMFWVAANIARVICAKMTLVIYQPVLFPGPANEGMSRAVRERLFTACTELFEYSYILTMDERTRQWRWLFQTYTQWQAVAYVLIESGRRPWSASVERAWNGLNSIMASSKPHDHEKMTDNASLFVPLKTLYNKARKHRNAEIERLRADPEEVARLDKEDRSRLNPTMFSAYHGSLDGLQWRERWLRLVGAPQLIDEPASVSTAASSMNPSTQNPSTPAGGLQLQQQLPQLPVQQLNQGQQQQQQQQQQGEAISSDPQYPANKVLDKVFANATFEPTDLYQVLSLGKSANGGPAEVFGSFGGADMPRQDMTLAAFATDPSLAFSNQGMAGGNGNGTGTTAQAAEATPLVDAIVKDYPPPWLWTSDSVDNNTSQFPSILADAGDVKMDDMDENFDWQDFSETLGGMSNGVWSSHGL
ncbi:hypothetical protein SPBR_02264 [Sporothrix brasiliensis 5110]|uniref:Zn(2)-C6 fungal-type domain-containing protein n=1 Tax=Sporothrix brasiliensis 5110 TaxID=1398154 RepID=A0A0C2J862_9PEZI|nr:uncharacterized protein SPBR_02264 [Sporothrix brasiliensis 5110]KIH93197.1 hypothetical protein SPBR_02264 [Sporothrix brasiliensis 5110]